MPRGRKPSLEKLLVDGATSFAKILSALICELRSATPVATVPQVSSPPKKRGRPKQKKRGRPKGSKKKATPVASTGKRRGRKPSPEKQMVLDGIAMMKSETLKEHALKLYHSSVDGIRVASPEKVQALLKKIEKMDGRSARKSRRLLFASKEQDVIKKMKDDGCPKNALVQICHTDENELNVLLGRKQIKQPEPPPKSSKKDSKTSPKKATKKKRGRPKGSKNKPKETPVASTGKKRGRPKGSKNKPKTTEQVKATDKPKKRGRPKGSKNKPKEIAKTKKATIQKTKPVEQDETRPDVIAAPPPSEETAPAAPVEEAVS